MMNIEIIAVGKLTDDFVKKGCAHYLKRLSPFANCSVCELSPAPLYDESPASVAAALEREGAAIQKRMNGVTVALCVEGEQMSSEGLARFISARALMGEPQIRFIIGSSHGLSEGVKERASVKLSLSKMTFPHELARLILCEQLYRAFSIVNNGRYHK